MDFLKLSSLLVLLHVSTVTSAQKIYDRVKEKDSCFFGKWYIAEAKYRKNYGLHNIGNAKKTNSQNVAYTEGFRYGYITFYENHTVEFTPANDTVIYKGKFTSKAYVHPAEYSIITITYQGAGAQYNMKWERSCPSLEKGKNVMHIFSPDGYGKYLFEEVKE